MRKLFVVLAVMGALALLASPASAFSFAQGYNEASLKDFGSTFSDGVPVNTAPAVGDEIRTIYWVDALKAGGGIVYNDGTNPELTGTVYDLVCMEVQDFGLFKIYLYGDAGRYAGYTGRMDVYEDPSNNRNGLPPNSLSSDPATWVANDAGNGGRDSFPTYTDGTYMIGATFLPIQNPLDGTTWQVGGQNVLLAQIFYPQHNGDTYTYAHLNVVEDPNNSLIKPTQWFDGIDGNGNPLLYTSDFRFTAHYDLRIPVPGGNLWPQSSTDPVEFNVIPEPGTIMLLSSGLIGLIPLIRRRK